MFKFNFSKISIISLDRVCVPQIIQSQFINRTSITNWLFCAMIYPQTFSPILPPLYLSDINLVVVVGFDKTAFICLSSFGIQYFISQLKRIRRLFIKNVAFKKIAIRKNISTICDRKD